MSKQALRHSTAGFTLIEMLTVILLAGILAAIAAPGWLSFMNNRRADAGRDQVLQLLRQAQSQATRIRQDQTVKFLTPANQLPQVEVSGIAQTINGQFSGATAKNFSLSVEGAGKSCAGAEGCIVFDDKGNIKQGAGTVINVFSPANSNTKRCVIVQTILGTMSSGSGEDCKVPS